MVASWEKKKKTESVDLLEGEQTLCFLVLRSSRAVAAVQLKHSTRSAELLYTCANQQHIYRTALFDVYNWIAPLSFALIEILIPLITLHIAVDITVDIRAVQIGL